MVQAKQLVAALQFLLHRPHADNALTISLCEDEPGMKVSVRRNKRFSLTRSFVGLVLCTTAVVLDVQAARVASGQAPTDILHVPELEAGFRRLYELKFVEARAQFENDLPAG